MTRYKINPGEFRHSITFQKLTKTQNSFGEEIEDWQDVVSAKAGIYPISGKEFFAADTISSEVTHKLNMRFLPNIKPNMRVKFGERYFDIKSIINFQERNIELQIMCSETL